jgi:hypothetical protein
MRCAPRLIAATLAVGVGCSSTAEPPAGPTSVPVLDENRRVPALACPGSPGCVEVSGALKVGAAKRSITPVVEPFTDTNMNRRWDAGEAFEDKNGNGRWDPTWMAGFDVGRAAQGVHDEQWARAIVLEQGELRVGYVSLDTIGFFHDDIIAIRQAAVDAGLDLDDVIVSSTHVHEGEDTMGLWGYPALVPSPALPPYLARIRADALTALKEAAANLREAKVTVAQGNAPTVVRDSRLPRIVDDLYTAIRFDAVGSGMPIATWVIWGNHPEALSDDNQLLTSDYPHFLRERIEAEQPGTTAVFSSGSLGGLMTPLGLSGCADAMGMPTCRPGDFAWAQEIGEVVARGALRALTSTAARTDAQPTLALARKSYLVPVTNFAFVAAFGAGVLTRQLFDRDGNYLPRVDDVSTENTVVETEVSWLRIGPIELLMVPGELYPEAWLQGSGGAPLAERPEGRDFADAPVLPALEGMLGADRLRAILNQTNDSLGYMIPKSQFDLFEPHAYRPDGQYGESNSTGAEITPDTVKAVAEMLGKPLP